MVTARMLLFLATRGWGVIPLGMSIFGPRLAYSGTALLNLLPSRLINKPWPLHLSRTN
jgi:hypothetical protein